MQASKSLKKFVRGLGIAALAMGLGVPAASANVVIGGTRVVFPAQEGSATVHLYNPGDHAALVQAWIDKGNKKARPDNVKTPFLITPPLFRLDAEKSQTIRIIFAPGDEDHVSLPDDRETLFWLNVLDVPPKPSGKNATKSYMQFSVRSRLKLFYRPADLSVSRSDAPGKLIWQRVTGKDGGQIEVHNPTPYYLTFSSISVVFNGQSHKASTGMVAPYEDLVLTVDGLSRPIPGDAVIQYETINDLGGEVSHKAQIKQ